MVTGDYSPWSLAFPKKPSVKAKHSALKTEFRPASKTQAVKLSKSFGVSRFAYNLAVTKASEMLSQKEQYPNFQALRNDLNSRKAKEFPWMFEVPKDDCRPTLS